MLAESATAQPRVLVVDDDQDTVESTSLLLELRGHAVRTARDGVEALAQMQAFCPHLVLLDLGMPGMDGYRTLDALRSVNCPDHAVFVALTGYATKEVTRRCAEAGFDLHLPKPVDFELIEQLPHFSAGIVGSLEASLQLQQQSVTARLE